MSNIWHDISPKRIAPEDFIAVIEIPQGSKKKYELDKETGLIILDRVLHTSTHYPANYGFIPRTYGDDGDPLDVLVLCSESMDPLTLVRVYPIGYISMLDDGKNDEKIIAIPFSDPAYNTYRDISELPAHIFDEMAHFFAVYKALEGKETVAGDVNGRRPRRSSARPWTTIPTPSWAIPSPPTAASTASAAPAADGAGPPGPRDFKRNLILSSFLSERETGTINHIKTTRQREV